MTVPQALAERPLEFTALGRAWCASALPVMALVLATLAASTRYAPALVVILGIAFFAVPLGCALSLHRCRAAARAGPLDRWEVTWRFLWTGMTFGLAIPSVIVGVLAFAGVATSIGRSSTEELASLAFSMVLIGLITALMGVVIALPLAWLAGWIASRTGFRPAAS